jgi:hypothetical protein
MLVNRIGKRRRIRKSAHTIEQPAEAADDSERIARYRSEQRIGVKLVGFAMCYSGTVRQQSRLMT